MSKIKLTKGELKKQRDALGQFRRYLPTLLLKKQQLQMRIREVYEAMTAVEARRQALEADIGHWSGLLGEQGADISGWVLPTGITTTEQNVAGVTIPVLENVVFAEVDYDFYSAPVWYDRAVVALRAYLQTTCEQVVLAEQVGRLEQELRVTSQRVNLFEKVKIPESLDNIRVIRIYLGDQQANAVGISKVAKKKLELVAA